MIGLYFVLALVLVLVGHAFRLLRWEQFIRIYERPLRGQGPQVAYAGGSRDVDETQGSGRVR